MTTITTPPAPTTTEGWQALVRDIGATHHPNVADLDRRGEIDVAMFDELRASGVTAALVPAEHGGGGATHAQMGAVLRELGRWDPSSAVTLAMHTHVLGLQVWRHHHGMDATGVFRKVVDGRAVLVSTGASDWISSNGTARRVDGGYRVSARKGPASGCEVGDVLATSIRWDDAPDSPQVLHCTVPSGAEGVSIERTWDTLGMRATGSHTVVFDDVFVPDAAVSLARPADQWHPIWNAVIGTAMPLIMAAYAGIADHAVDIAVAAAAPRPAVERVQLIGEMLNAHTTASDMIAAMFADADDLHFEHTDALAARTLCRKTVAADALIGCVRLAIEATGGAGFSRTSPLERLYRDVHGCLFHPLPRAKQTQFSGRVALGLSPVG